jgi:hypothetical protein
MSEWLIRRIGRIGPMDPMASMRGWVLVTPPHTSSAYTSDGWPSSPLRSIRLTKAVV